MVAEAIATPADCSAPHRMVPGQDRLLSAAGGADADGRAGVLRSRPWPAAVEHFLLVVLGSVCRVDLADRGRVSECAVSADRFSEFARAVQCVGRREASRLDLPGRGLLPRIPGGVDGQGWLRSTKEVLNRFPSGPILLFHAWVTLSAVIAVGRNIWQSASELSLRGLAYNVWLTRGISWHDDYYPLQDPFFYSVALAMLFGTWALLSQGGERLLKGLVGVVLAGATANVVFALWQKATGMGWVNGQWSINANALWPDLHSFGAFMACGPVSRLRIPGDPCHHPSVEDRRSVWRRSRRQ